MARHVGCSKLESKPVQLYDRLGFRPLGHKRTTLATGIFRYFIFSKQQQLLFTFFHTLSAPRVLNSFEELCITLTVADNSFARELIYIYIYIYIYILFWFFNRWILTGELEIGSTVYNCIFCKEVNEDWSFHVSKSLSVWPSLLTAAPGIFLYQRVSVFPLERLFFWCRPIVAMPCPFVKIFWLKLDSPYSSHILL